MTRPPVALPRVVLAAYAAPAFSQALIHGPVGTVIQGVYGTHFGVALGSIAAVLLVARVFDAVTDPLIGYLSDRIESRWGHRKPWLVAGSLLAVVACWFLYVPPGEVSTTYFLTWFLLAYLGWTISEIPYRAWLAELSRDYDERTRIATWRTFARYLGFMAFYGIPFLPFFETSEFTPESLRVTAILASVALPLTAVLAAWVVPRGDEGLKRQQISLRSALPAILSNRPLLYFLAIFAICGISTGMSYGTLFFFVGNYLQQGETLALLFFLGAPVGALCMPLWSGLARRIGKQQTWAIAYAVAGLLLLLHLAIPVGADGQVPLVLLSLLVFAVSSVGVVVPAAMLADVVDYGRWKYRGDYAGSYYSVQTMMEKGVEGIGAAAGLALAVALGFDATAGEQTRWGVIGLLLAFPVLPALINFASVPLIWRFPIDERRQRLIARRLEQRESRA